MKYTKGLKRLLIYININCNFFYQDKLNYKWQPKTKATRQIIIITFEVELDHLATKSKGKAIFLLM